MYCNNCDKELPDDAIFCPVCGEKIDRPQKNKKRTAELFYRIRDDDITVQDVKRLIEHGADVNAKYMGITPLGKCKNAEVAEVLRENGARSNI